MTRGAVLSGFRGTAGQTAGRALTFQMSTRTLAILHLPAKALLGLRGKPFNRRTKEDSILVVLVDRTGSNGRPGFDIPQTK